MIHFPIDFSQKELLHSHKPFKWVVRQNLEHKTVISSVGTTNQFRSNLLTQESQEIKNHQAKKTPNLPQAVDGVVTKDTPAKHALRKMLPVTNAKKKDTFKLFVAALHCQQRKYGNWKKMKSRKREMRFCFSENSDHRGRLDCATRG